MAPKLIALNKLGEIRNQDPTLYQVIQELQQQVNEYILGQASGGGSVTSIAQTVPSDLLAVTGSPVTGSGTLALTLPTRAANTVFSGPALGAAASPTFRASVYADLPVEAVVGNVGGAQAVANGTPLLLFVPVTIPSTGNYHVSFNAGLVGIAGQLMDVYLAVNGGAPAHYSFLGLAESAGQNLAVCGYEYLAMNAGDTLGLVIYHHGGGANTTTTTSNLIASRAH